MAGIISKKLKKKIIPLKGRSEEHIVQSGTNIVEPVAEEDTIEVWEVAALQYCTISKVSKEEQQAHHTVAT